MLEWMFYKLFNENRLIIIKCVKMKMYVSLLVVLSFDTN